MANDPFLTKKSIAGLAERVLLSPPPERVNLWICNSTEFDLDDLALLTNMQIGQIACGYCTSGGGYLQCANSFPCILQKNDANTVYMQASSIADDGDGLHLVGLYLNLKTFKYL